MCKIAVIWNFLGCEEFLLLSSGIFWSKNFLKEWIVGVDWNFFREIQIYYIFFRIVLMFSSSIKYEDSVPFVLTWVHCDDLKPWYPTKKYIPKHLNVMYELRLDKKYDMIGILRYKYFRKIFIWRTFSFKCVILSVCGRNQQ